jgi:hypothetical protein
VVKPSPSPFLQSRSIFLWGVFLGVSLLAVPQMTDAPTLPADGSFHPAVLDLNKHGPMSTLTL